MSQIRSIYFSLFSKLGVAFLIFTICRILFYVWNAAAFSEVSLIPFLGGLRFDWLTITILYLPFWFAHLFLVKGKSLLLKILFHFSNSIAILLSCLDLEYFKFTFKRTTADLFTTAGIGNDILNILPAFLSDYWYVILLAIALMLLSNFLYNKTPNPFKEKMKVSHYLLFFLPSFAFFAIGSRGGLQYKPLNVMQAAQYANAGNVPIVLNTPFTIIKSAYKEDLSKKEFFEPNELQSIYSPVQQLQSDSAARKMNVVLIIAESFSKEYIGYFNGGKGYTPYLDELIENSLVFENSFANGKKSIEALPALLSGIPTLMNGSYISSKHGSNRIESVGYQLNEIGYKSTFYHGGENGTMGFNSFVSIAGMDNYVGRDQYPNQQDYDGNWGIFDEPFLQFVLSDLDQKKQPFFATIFTLSSHHPYTVPEQYDAKFPEGPLPILKSVGYADFAIHQFIEGAKRQEWFEETLFIITADHTSHNYLPQYNNRIGWYEVPLIFYAPKQLKAEVRQELVQHTDIYPSILDFLNINEEIVSFGSSVFDSTETRFAVSYLTGIYQLIEGDFCLHFDGEKSIGLYAWKEDRDLINNLVRQETKQLKKMERKLKAIIQQYNSRLIENRLTIKSSGGS